MLVTFLMFSGHKWPVATGQCIYTIFPLSQKVLWLPQPWFLDGPKNVENHVDEYFYNFLKGSAWLLP